MTGNFGRCFCPDSRFLGIMIAVRAGIRYLRADSRKRGIQYGGDQAICGDPSLPGKCRRVVARASDGFAASYDKAEFLQPENILVVYAKDGLPLENAAAGGAGPLRIVVVDDPFGNRCIKHLCELEIEQ